MQEARHLSKLKKLGVVFFAKVQALIMAVAGLIAGVLYSFGGFFYELSTGNLNSGTALAFLALIGMPLIFAGVGFLAGAIGALLYNLVALWTGGIEADLDIA